MPDISVQSFKWSFDNDKWQGRTRVHICRPQPVLLAKTGVKSPSEEENHTTLIAVIIDTQKGLWRKQAALFRFWIALRGKFGNPANTFNDKGFPPDSP